MTTEEYGHDFGVVVRTAEGWLNYPDHGEQSSIPAPEVIDLMNTKGSSLGEAAETLEEEHSLVLLLESWGSKYGSAEALFFAPQGGRLFSVRVRQDMDLPYYQSLLK